MLTTVDAPAEGATLTVEATITDAAGNVSDKGTETVRNWIPQRRVRQALKSQKMRTTTA
ncbi:hypothetical protein [Vibrio cyclitrophicus]|uniref:hypothetical protein n=1 Tax=Vibrio cyclitrophicus TaxID=47951 RepID=UPI0035A5AC9E